MPFVADGGVELVDEGNKAGIVGEDGSVTREQRLVTFEPMQHESVALGELVAQKSHRDCKFEENPQLFGSLSSPVIQEPLREFAGKAQLVKSALI